MYVIGILAYALGYILMGLTGNFNKIRSYPIHIFISLSFSMTFHNSHAECHREHIFGRKSTAACLTCLPCLGILTIAILVLWFFTESFTGTQNNRYYEGPRVWKFLLCHVSNCRRKRYSRKRVSLLICCTCHVTSVHDLLWLLPYSGLPRT